MGRNPICPSVHFTRIHPRKTAETMLFSASQAAPLGGRFVGFGFGPFGLEAPSELDGFAATGFCLGDLATIGGSRLYGDFESHDLWGHELGCFQATDLRLDLREASAKLRDHRLEIDVIPSPRRRGRRACRRARGRRGRRGIRVRVDRAGGHRGGLRKGTGVGIGRRLGRAAHAFAADGATKQVVVKLVHGRAKDTGISRCSPRISAIPLASSR
jgi:hypothetical protein